MTYEEQLETVQAAIQKIETGGQEVLYDGKRVTRADLQTLYTRESALERKISRSRCGGGLRIFQGTPE